MESGELVLRRKEPGGPWDAKSTYSNMVVSICKLCTYTESNEVGAKVGH